MCIYIDIYIYICTCIAISWRTQIKHDSFSGCEIGTALASEEQEVPKEQFESHMTAHSSEILPWLYLGGVDPGVWEEGGRSSDICQRILWGYLYTQYIYTYIYRHIYIYTHIHIHIYIYIYIYLCNGI